MNHYFNCELSYQLKGVVRATKSYDAVDKKGVSSGTKELVSWYNFYIKWIHLRVQHNTIFKSVPLLFWQGSYGILKNPAELYSDIPVAKMEPKMI